MQIRGQLVDIVEQKITPVEITVEGGFIRRITPIADAAAASNTSGPQPASTASGNTPGPQPAGAHANLPFILPGFIEAHVHIESSLLIPSEFARMAVIHGTIATVSDMDSIVPDYRSGTVCSGIGSVRSEFYHIDSLLRRGGHISFCHLRPRRERILATLYAAVVRHVREEDTLPLIAVTTLNVPSWKSANVVSGTGLPGWLPIPLLDPDVLTLTRRLASLLKARPHRLLTTGKAKALQLLVRGMALPKRRPSMFFEDSTNRKAGRRSHA